jgi:adhesin transport system outer membrane protein
MAQAQQDNLHESLSISLHDALATGITSNPQYSEVASNRRATDEELNQGRALYLPSIDLHAETGPEYTDSATTRIAGDDHVSKWRNLGSITLTQLLFDGFQTHYEIERQKARVSSAAHRVRETADLVGLSIVNSYLEVLRQRELITIAMQNVEDHNNIFSQIEDGVNGGRSTQADLEQAKARRAAASAIVASTRQALNDAEAKYRQVVGDSAGRLQVPQTPVSEISGDVNTEVQKALAFSPTLDIYAADIETAYAESLGTRSSFYPKVNLQLNASEGHDLSGIDGRDTNASALVVANWNLYRGGADMARSREFIHRHQQAKEARARAAREVENDVRTTWDGMISARERGQEFSTQAEANAQVVGAYKDQFNLDRRTLLDVLDAQNELFVSRSNVINARYTEMLGAYRLLALKGSLLPVLGVAYPRESLVSNNDTWTASDKMKAR